jgi:tetratricopeptide (TPR) repeat protein
MEIALRGQLGERLVADLIREAAQQKLTGLLRLSQDKTMKAIFFESGAPVFAISNLPTEQIDHKLVKARLAAAGLVEAAKKKADNSQKLGRALVQTGVVTEQVLQQASSELAAQTILSLFEWEQGDYVFNEAPATDLEARLTWSPADCILRGTRQAAKLESVANALAPGYRIVAPVMSNGDSIGSSAALTPAEGFVLSSITGPTPISEVSTLTGLSDVDVRSAVCVLLSLGLLAPLGDSRKGAEETTWTDELPPLEQDVAPAESSVPSFNPPPTPGAQPYSQFPAAAVPAYSPPPVPMPNPLPPQVSVPRLSPAPVSVPNPSAPLPPPASVFSPPAAAEEAPQSSPADKSAGRYSQVSVEWVIEMATRKLQSISSANYYEVLGVDRFATNAMVSKAYYDLKDMFTSFRSRWPENPALNTTLEALFAKIDKAYATLSDSNKRRLYDMPATMPQVPKPVIERGGAEALSGKARRVPPINSSPSTGLDLDPTPGAYTSGLRRPGHLSPELAAEEQYRRGRAHYDRKDFHSAAHLFREAVNLDPRRGHYHYFLGVTLSILSQARKVHNHDEGCHVTCKIGGSLVRNQRVRHEAEQHLLKAADLDRNNPEIRLRLGLLYKDAGMEKKAEQFFNETLMLDAGNPIALRELGLDGGQNGNSNY